MFAESVRYNLDPLGLSDTNSNLAIYQPSLAKTGSGHT
jgi:hypothetical protein